MVLKYTYLLFDSIKWKWVKKYIICYKKNGQK